MSTSHRPSLWESTLGFFVANKLVVWVLLGLMISGGLSVMPFDDWDLGGLPRNPVPVDAIPDIGENQQIVFTDWPGRSPRDIEDQITYPLTTALLGIPGVQSVRSFSMFGFSSIYVIFEEDIEFYWSRSRILEKLNALPAGTLPDGVSPALGPDATALGQVFWYTLEGRDAQGNVVGGWDLHELRSLQDWTVRYALQAVPGVSEVASIGGYVQEYQVDVDPEAMRAHNVSLTEVVDAVRSSNLDVGARTMEINKVEYVVRGVGFLEEISDLEQTVVVARENTPIRISDVARVTLGPADRRGLLDVAGAEAVGGVVVARYGENPLAVIERVKEKIEELQPSLPRRTLADGTVSQVTLVPFYDRTTLINETLGTLSSALVQQILITILVVLLLMGNLRSSFLIALMLPLAVLLTFLAMRLVGVDANVMSLAGIAIAIGTMVDMGIVLTENIYERRENPPLDPDGEAESLMHSVTRAAAEVAPAVLTSVATTVVSFIPVFGLTAAEGKFFTPVAYTKTFALLAALAISLLVLPPLAHIVFTRGGRMGVRLRERGGAWLPRAATIGNAIAVIVTVVLLTQDWMPLGWDEGMLVNLIAVALPIFLVIGSFVLFRHFYEPLLRVFLAHKLAFLSVPVVCVLFGLTAWLGFDRTFGWLPHSVRLSAPLVRVAHTFPGFGREFMPPFDEGSFLVMPSTMPHASFGQSREMLQGLDAALQTIPEVDGVVGKLGRVESSLDPAPASMFEIVVNYVPEYRVDADGDRVRQWRDDIRTSDDIWREIVRVMDRPDLTSAPQLMPIQTRIIMLQTGMRAAMGLKVKGHDLESIETASLRIEEALRNVPSIRPQTVFAERVVGKPYLEIHIDREAIGRYGLTIEAVQNVIEYAVGGMALTRTVEGRERYPVRVRYMREERDSLEALRRVFVPTANGEQVPLEEVAQIVYERGPQAIKSEDTFLTSYVIFDKIPEMAETEVVEVAAKYLRDRIASGDLQLPDGVSYEFAGSYENQVRSEQRLGVLIPVALALILLILYLQFRSTVVAFIIYTGVAVAMSGGFILLWLYGQPWFFDVTVLGTDLRELFQIHPTNMSVAVWVGFIALIGVATDDGVVMSTYLDQRFRENPTDTVGSIREQVVEAGLRRVRPCLMTTATTILALLPVITSQGRGADVMVPMALPSVGGMMIELMTLFVVPVLYSAWQELRLRWS